MHLSVTGDNIATAQVERVFATMLRAVAEDGSNPDMEGEGAVNFYCGNSSTASSSSSISLSCSTIFCRVAA